MSTKRLKALGSFINPQLGPGKINHTNKRELVYNVY